MDGTDEAAQIIETALDQGNAQPHNRCGESVGEKSPFHSFVGSMSEIACFSAIDW
jgi:hypothetical protein